MPQPFKPNNTQAKRYRLSSVVVAILLTITFATAARPAQAQWTTFDIPQMLGNVWDKIKDAASWAYERGAAIAFRNAAKTFTQQIAYNAAVQLTSGGEGQLPLFEVRNFGQVLKDAGDSAAGSYIEELGKGFTAFNVCDPSGVNPPFAKLIIGTALFNEVKPQKPKEGCKLSSIINNWDKTLNDPRKRAELLGGFGVAFDDKQNDLGVSLRLQQNLVKEQQKSKEAAAGDNIKNLGYLPITETITNFIKTPAPELKAQREFTTQQIFDEPLVFTGDIIADALGVFTNTFAARFMKRLQQGVVPQPSKLASGRFGGNFGAPAGGVEYAIQINSSLSVPELKQESVDILSEFSNCPQNPALAPANACTIDTRFVQALRLAQSGTPLTVQEAADRGLIRGDWLFREKRDSNIRTPDAWYVSDLKKLRRARIIPVGWELAAQVAVGGRKTLQQVMGTKGLNYSDGFNGTGPDGKCGALDSDPTGSDDTAVTDDTSAQRRLATSYCGLIDPTWVLKAPPAQCRILAYGQQLEFEGGQRQQSCVDLQHCVAENEDGSCQAWGYCTQEKNIWRFSGESCEFPEGSGYSPYATCTTFQNSNGGQVSYLKNSLANYDDGVCSGAAGCRWYSSVYTPTAGTCQGGTNVGAACTAANAGAVCLGGGLCQPAPAKLYDDVDAARVYLKELERYGCDANSEGCHQFLRLSQTNISAIPGTCSGSGAACTASGDCPAPQTCVRPGANPVEQVLNHVVATPAASYQSFARVSAVTLKEAPANLNCYDADATNDDPLCKNFLAQCQQNEVGCELYAPSDGSPSIPAVASVTDTCPSECAGFNTYEQLPSFFEPNPDYDTVAPGAQPDANFIPTTALKCSASQVGCEEFTNIEAGETREYFSELRQCIEPGTGADHTYYTWVGSDLTGYQLRSWQLKASSADPNAAPAVTANNAVPPFVDAQDCRPDGSTFPTGDPDCKQFYDSTGGIHYRFASKTITTSDSCTRYRATNVNVQADCEGTGGRWEQPAGATQFFCFYDAIPQEGQRCSAAASGCREFKGPKADNVKLVFPVSTFGDREPGVNADTTPLSGWTMTSPTWAAGTNSTESTSAFGHSLNSGSPDNSVGRDVSGLIQPGKQYVISLWAKQNSASAHNLFVQFTDGPHLVKFGSLQPITQEWKVYTFGPAEVPLSATAFDTTGAVTLHIGSTPYDDNFYVDNVALREVQDTFYVRKNTWTTPLACQAPQHLRCSAYTDRARNRYTLTGFSQLCRAEAVGCEALVDTRNTDSPRSTTFAADNQAALANLDLDKADRVVYRVYDTKKSCAATAQACYRVGQPTLATTGEVVRWSDKFVKLDPDTFVKTDGTTSPLSPLCGKAQDRCAEFKDSSGGSHFFRDPGTQVCEYKLVDNLRGYDWYKKGTDELCNLVPNQSFEQFRGTTDDTEQEVFTGWERNGDVVEAQRGELYATSSVNGQYWGATALKIRSTPFQYSGVWSSPISIGKPTDPNPSRTFLFTAHFYVPTSAARTKDWEFSRHAYGASCGGGVSCHQYNLIGGNVYVTSSDPAGQWLTRSYVIRTNSGVYTLALGIITNVGAPFSSDGDEIYVDDVRIVELPNALSNDQAVSIASAGYANTCPSDQNTCTAFRDPALTKQTYYYLDNGKLDAAACSGRVSEKEGCLLFNKLSDVNASWSTADTYQASRNNSNQAVAPVPGGTGDSNIILKVRRDRVCDEWLSCQSESVRFSGTQARSICYALGRCNQWGASGVGKCGNWLNPETSPKPLDASTYRARMSSPKGSDPNHLDWADPEYSGYSIPNYYPIDTLTQKNYSTDPESPSLRLTYLDTNDKRCGGLRTGSVCTTIGSALSPCNASAVCGYVDYGVSGNGPGVDGEWAATAPKLCRAYPEADSPFTESVVKEWADSCPPGSDCDDTDSIIQLAKTKETGFKDANNCQPGEDCECTYQKASYTQGENLYYGFNRSVAKQFSIEGDGIVDASGSPIDNNKDIYSKLKRQDYLIGLKGYCLEKDPSRLVYAGGVQDQSCITWMPLDVVGGEISIYDYANEAGFNNQNISYYCSAQASHQYGTTPYVLPYGTAGCVTGISQGWRKETSLVLPPGPPVYRDDIESIHIAEMRTADDGGSCYNDGDDCAKGDVWLPPTADFCAFVDYQEDEDSCDGPASCNSGAQVNQMRNGGGLFRPSGSGWNNIGNYGAFCGGHWSGVAAMAIFDASNRFLGINVSACSDYGGSGSAKVSAVEVRLKRNYCSELTKVTDNTENKAWTNRTLNPSSGYEPQVGASGETYTFTVSGQPYGAVVGQVISTGGGSLTPLVPVQQSGPLYAAAPYSCSSLWPGYTCAIGGRYNRCVGGTQSPNACTTTSSTLCTGGACVGTIIPVAPEPVPPPQSFAGVRVLQEMFARIYDVFRINSALPRYDVLPAGSVPFSLDVSSGGVAPTKGGLVAGFCLPNTCLPFVNLCQLDPSRACSSTADCQLNICTAGRCTFTNDVCSAVGQSVPDAPMVKQVIFNPITKAPQEGLPGFTLVSVDGVVTQGDLGLASPAPVTAIFYAYNPNGEQMPLREVLVDWDGNPDPAVGTNSGAPGKYKNRKHMCASPKACQGGPNPGKVCASTADCGTGGTCIDNPSYTFGDTPQACIQDAPNTEGYFSFTKVFMCSGNETACAPGQADGCYQANALGAGQGACVFTPKVFVKDNWEWCTGTTGAGAWGSTDCNATNQNSWLRSSQTNPVRILVKPKS